ncbi:hypothetical protein [Streptomyces sp. NPDC003023]
MKPVPAVLGAGPVTAAVAVVPVWTAAPGETPAGATPGNRWCSGT